MKTISIPLVCFLFVLSSCLKQSNEVVYPGNVDNSKRIVSIALSPIGDNFRKLFIEKRTTEQTIDFIPVALPVGVIAETDLFVVLDTSFAKVTVYNAVQGTSFSRPDPTKFSIVNKTVLIPKGQNMGYMQIRLTPNNFLGGTFALGFSIVGVSNGYTIAQNNASSAVTAFTLMNPFEGNYTNTGARYDYYGGPYYYNGSGPVPPYTFAHNLGGIKFGSTLDQKTTEFDFSNLGSNTAFNYRYVVTVPVGTTGTTNVTVPLTFSTTFLLANSGIQILVSTYNPSTKTFHFVISYLNQPSGGNQRIIDETLVMI